MNNAKKAALSAAILVKMANGASVREAIDAVLGAGTSAQVIDAVWRAAQ